MHNRGIVLVICSFIAGLSFASWSPSGHAASCTDRFTYLDDGHNVFTASSDENNIVEAYAGSDWIKLRNCSDVVFGGRGPDNLQGQLGPDNLYGEKGGEITNNCPTGSYCGIIRGGKGDDRLHGNEHNDLLLESDQTDDRDKLWGGYGDDNIGTEDGDGLDEFHGGPGTDICQFDLEPGDGCEIYP